MRKIKIIIGFILTLIVSGCANYFISTNSLVDQLKQNQNIRTDWDYQKYSLIDYPSNNLYRIECIDEDSNRVWLYPDKNTEFIFTLKTNGDVEKAYFDTVIFQNDTLYGLRSRLFGGKKIIPVKDIDKIEIYAEFPKIQRIK